MISDEGLLDSAMPSLHEAFQNYIAEYFTNELRECKSSAEFEGLIDELDLIRHNLKVDVSIQIAKTRAEADKFEEHQSTYENHMYDEWKDRRYDERQDDSTVRDMFGSLRSVVN